MYDYHSIINGRVITINNESEFKKINSNRGKYSGPGVYLEIFYFERCPRNCCDLDITELLDQKESLVALREAAKEIGYKIIEIQKAAQK